MKALSESKLSRNWKSFLAYRDRRLQGIQTGIGSLDRYLLGLGGLTSIQGGTGTNKSTLALQIVHHNLKLGNPCIALDKENGDGRLRMRLLCQHHNISETDVKVCSLEELKEYRKPLLEYPLHIHTEQIEGVDAVRERLDEGYKMYGEKPIILLVDSLQALDPLDDDPRLSIEKWVYALDSLKVQYDGKLTVLLTSEKNRSSYERVGIGGGKGSNAIDYKPETILELTPTPDPLMLNVTVAKNRDGVSGATIPLRKRLADSTNPASFTFMLEEVEAGGEF